MERINLANINEKSVREAKSIVYQMARDYSPLIGLDFDKQILPDLANFNFWEVDYLTGSEWGLSIMDAYRCLVDVHRTTQIMGGIKETIDSLRVQGKKEIYAIDAGTGTGVFSIYMAALGVDKIFALELNEKTAELAEKYIASYGLTDKIKVIVGDATKMDIPELHTRPADILVSENLSGGLFAEPQFQIINHLSKFLNLEAPILPFKANLSVGVGYGYWDKVDWNNKTPRIEIAARRVPNITDYLNGVEFASVLSESGMSVPRITNDVTVNAETPANTLLISTFFQINKTGIKYELTPNSAEFLGKTSAIKLPNNAIPQNGKLNVKFNYEAGFSIKNNPDSLTVNGNLITLKDR
ncbi:MAG: 50S ribosomal protein L11 methyltransferase [Candidatus Woesebacteria bacterium]|nr:50S ribosomal protein L11 methyltransferase [Candidatus Woesebacteria bacterium]